METEVSLRLATLCCTVVLHTFPRSEGGARIVSESCPTKEAEIWRILGEHTD